MIVISEDIRCKREHFVAQRITSAASTSVMLKIAFGVESINSSVDNLSVPNFLKRIIYLLFTIVYQEFENLGPTLS